MRIFTEAPKYSGVAALALENRGRLHDFTLRHPASPGQPEGGMTSFEDRRVYLDPEILGPEDAREERVRTRLWTTIKRAARSIPFMEDVVAAWYCAIDPTTPRKVRLTLLAALAYFVAPIDGVPDLLPLIGFGDDAAVLMAAITMVRSHIRPDHVEAARRAMAEQ